MPVCLYLLLSALCVRREASYDEEIGDGEEDAAAAAASEAHTNLGRGPTPRQTAMVRRPSLDATSTIV